jgi:hypothetical protein
MGSYMYVSTESSVHALSVAPSAGNPLILQTVWADTGVAHNHNWCSVEGVIFAFVSKQGAVTMDAMGRPSNEFARVVARKMRDWDPEDVTVLHAPDLNSVLFCNGGDAYGWNYQTLQWSSPAQCNDFATGDIISGVVIDRALKICLLNGSTFSLYDFNASPTPTDAAAPFKIVSPDLRLNPTGRINLLGLKAEFRAPNAGDYTVSLATDYGAVEKTLTHTAEAAGMQQTALTRWCLLRRNAFRVEWAGIASDVTSDTYLNSIEIFGAQEDSSALT